MFAVIGVLLLAFGIVSFQFAYIQHNRPTPARWTRPELVSQLFCVGVLCVAAAGGSAFARFAIFSGLASLTPIELGLIAAIAGVGAVLFVAQVRWWRRLKAAASASSELPASNDDSDPGRPPTSGAVGRRRRRAA